MPGIEDRKAPRPNPPASMERQARLLLVVMVAIGYLLTFVYLAGPDAREVTPLEVALGISFGLVYLLLGLYENTVYDRLPAGLEETVFFTVQCALLLGIGYLLGTGGSFLIGAPLAAFAVERLAPRRRWLVFVALAATVVLPTGLRFGNWIDALINGALASAAIAFVAVFAQIRLNEQRARERAERLMVELEEANRRLAAYATQAEELAVTQERNRLAREIHDSLGHYLTIVNVQIEAAKTVMDTDPDRALDAMGKAQELAQKGLNRVRESVAALRESPVSSRPLPEAIASLVEEAQSTGIVTEFRVIGEPRDLENRVALALYRAAQEGLTNVRKHARASRVDVLLTYRGHEVHLELRDNGVGAAQTSGGFGLLGIGERMHLLDGEMEIETGVGKGFCLTATVPAAAGPARPGD